MDRRLEAARGPMLIGGPSSPCSRSPALPVLLLLCLTLARKRVQNIVQTAAVASRAPRP